MQGFFIFFGNKEGCIIHRIDSDDVDVKIDYPENKSLFSPPKGNYQYTVKLKGMLFNPKAKSKIRMIELVRRRLGGLSEIMCPTKKPIYLETKKEYLKREQKEIFKTIKR